MRCRLRNRWNSSTAIRAWPPGVLKARRRPSGSRSSGWASRPDSARRPGPSSATLAGANSSVSSDSSPGLPNFPTRLAQCQVSPPGRDGVVGRVAVGGRSATVSRVVRARDAPRAQGRRSKPPRPRHCNRGRNPRMPLAGEAGKARGVGRSESQETCPGAIRSPVFEGGSGQVAPSFFVVGGARSGKSRFAVERLRPTRASSSSPPPRRAMKTWPSASLAIAPIARRAGRPSKSPSIWCRGCAASKPRATESSWTASPSGSRTSCSAATATTRSWKMPTRSPACSAVVTRASPWSRTRSVKGAPGGLGGPAVRDLLGDVNQRIAAACETVVLMVAGIPLTVKTPGART